MPEPIRDLLEGYAQPPVHDVAAVARTVVARGRRKVRRRRAAAVGALVALVVLTGIAGAGAVGSDRRTRITTAGDPGGSQTTVEPTAPGRSFGLTQAQSDQLYADHAATVERCVEAKGFDMTIESEGPGNGRVNWGHDGPATHEELAAMQECSEVAGAAEEEARDQMLSEAGNPVVTLALEACPALEDVVVRGDLPQRFKTDGVLGHAGGIPLNSCFGTITTGGSGAGEITVSEGISGDSAAATRDEGPYLVGPVTDGFIAVYNGDQLPGHYIEASDVTEQEFDSLISSLQPQ